MKKKAEAEARDSLLQSGSDCSNGDSVSSSASVPDDAKELIAAMQNECNPAAADARLSGQTLKTQQSQKSRARRLTATAVALAEVPQPVMRRMCTAAAVADPETRMTVSMPSADPNIDVARMSPNQSPALRIAFKSFTVTDTTSFCASQIHSLDPRTRHSRLFGLSGGSSLGAAFLLAVRFRSDIFLVHRRT